jgi:hypothetical protein
MATVTTTARRPRTEQSADPITERKAKPIKYWAAFGAACWAMQAYIYGRWIFSDGFEATPKGPDPVPGWMKAEIHATEAISLIGLVICGYIFLIRPWRRDGRISLDGMFMLGFVGLWWQDLLMNYIQPIATYNAEFFNRGSWFLNYPGWISPKGGNYPEPMLMALPFYVYGCYGATVLGCFVMRRAKQRWPHMGRLGLMGVAFTFFAIFDFILEPLVVLRLGWWSYPGSIKGLTVFYGEYYQFPLYGMVLMSATWTAWASLRFFKNDKGQIAVEKGVDDLKVSTTKKNVIRFLAISGCLNVMWLIYMVPIQPFAINADAWPKVYETRSYLTNGLCGPNTTYACPGKDTPIPRLGSPHLDPRGQLVVPQR